MAVLSQHTNFSSEIYKRRVTRGPPESHVGTIRRQSISCANGRQGRRLPPNRNTERKFPNPTNTFDWYGFTERLYFPHQHHYTLHVPGVWKKIEWLHLREAVTRFS